MLIDQVCHGQPPRVKLPELNPVYACRGFPTELIPRGWPCCIVRILEECGIFSGGICLSVVVWKGHRNYLYYIQLEVQWGTVPGS